MPVDSRSILQGYPQEGLSVGGDWEGVIQWECAWDDRYYIRDLLINGGGEQFPYGSQSGTEGYVQHVSVRPMSGEAVGVSAGLAVYTKAIIEAKYGFRAAGVPQPDPGNPNKLISESIDPTVEFLTVDHRSYQWASPYRVPKTIDANGNVTAWDKSRALSADQAPGYQMYGLIYTYTRHNMAQVPTALLSLYGTSNLNPVVSVTFGLTFPPETLVLLPTPINVTWIAVGGWLLKKVELSLKLHYRNIPSWNKFWRPDLYNETVDSMWDTIERYDGTPLKQYPPKDWSSLWA